MAARVICVVQARFGSSRLPGKALRPVAGRPMIAHVVERAQRIPGIDDLVLATSDQDRDDLLAETVSGLGCAVVRGSEHDVLDRMFVAATLTRADVVVRVTGDCPCLDPDVGGQVLTLQRDVGGYVWNDTSRSGYPDGTDVEVFPYLMLEVATRRARSTRDREHVTPWIRDHYDVTTLVASTFDYSWVKLSVDTFDDLERVRAIMGHLPRGAFALEDTMAAFRCGCI
jgi:spore coat polysaccharide biosynthesis protein SpsF (cytidylyltransferase family)